MRNGMTNVPNRLMNVPPKRIHAAGGSARRLSRKESKGTIITRRRATILTASAASLSGSPVESRGLCSNRLPRGLTGDPDRLAALAVRMDRLELETHSFPQMAEDRA